VHTGGVHTGAVGSHVKILVVGAGGIGGYFGARLLAAGRQVTFLVRARRAEELRRSGLVVLSAAGDLHLAAPPTVDAAQLDASYDMILLSCKSYDLEACIADFSPAMQAHTQVLPLLNGMRHMEALDARFGSGRVLGGAARISSTLDAQGSIHHLGHFNTLVFGGRGAGGAEQAAAVAEALQVPGFEAIASNRIMQDMWEKWVFIATAAALTCLMRATVGDIVAAGAADIAVGLMGECERIAAENGFPPARGAVDAGLSILTAPGSNFTASMFRDIENRSRTEGQHIVGDLLARSKAAHPLLTVANAHLRSYEARRAREAKAREPVS
jgi:2-dehydropantoate 2-reductase